MQRRRIKIVRPQKHRRELYESGCCCTGSFRTFGSRWWHRQQLLQLPSQQVLCCCGVAATSGTQPLQSRGWNPCQTETAVSGDVTHASSYDRAVARSRSCLSSQGRLCPMYTTVVGRDWSQIVPCVSSTLLTSGFEASWHLAEFSPKCSAYDRNIHMKHQ